MSEKIDILEHASKEHQYQNILPQIKALLEGESDTIANLANVSAVLKEAFGFLWVGFYIVKKQQLVLGPFQGRIACTRINFGKGVCGTAWKENRTVLVADVDTFVGHIACDSQSRSEIVVPIRKRGEVVAVLDVDSEVENNFSEVDAKYLQEIVCFLEEKYFH